MIQKKIFFPYFFLEILSGIFVPDHGSGFISIPAPGVKKAPDPEFRSAKN
jgi:hypothetical protein